MRTLGGLASHITAEAMTLATCWRVARQDGTIYTFTDHDQDLVVGAETYVARTGYKRSAVTNASNGSVDNVEIQGFVDDASISELDVRRGLWDYAEIRLFVVDWTAPDAGQAKLRRGWLGEVRSTDTGAFVAELVGMAQLLAQVVGEVYSPECPAQLGDARCTVDLAAFTTTGAIGGDPASTTVFPAGLGAEYTEGVLTFTGGLNAGVKREILEADGSTVTLFLPPPYVMAAGDTFTAVQGCDKKLLTCRDKFNNVPNFRGHPFIPGADALLWVGVPAPTEAGDKK